jgi:myosin heavy subunit
VFLNTTLKTLKNANLYDSIINQFFYQLFYFMDCIVFNELMEHTERLSSTTHGFEIALAVSTLLEWSDRHVSGLPRDQLFQHVLQAANVMVMDKSLLTDKETLTSVWPALNPSQIYRLISFFSSDPTASDAVPNGNILLSLYSFFVLSNCYEIS